ncbi:adaptin ear-binding coat-associated protein 1 NECAP-1 [Chytriomyces sp. MP71]|nr:adaptin ear-binding coat-associated protein 1 NECAP-1 [Chytriomyces sp. MP71]
MADDSYESVLLVLKECTAYRPASDWDVNSFLWKGRLRIISKGDDCYIHWEDSTTGELFAACPYPPDGSSVESVLDSSRYFVLTLVDKASGRKAYIGMGFEERSSAFDFNVALQDYAKRARGGSAQPTAAKQATQQPAIDFSLKGDQTFSIKIGGVRRL